MQSKCRGRLSHALLERQGIVISDLVNKMNYTKVEATLLFMCTFSLLSDIGVLDGPIFQIYTPISPYERHPLIMIFESQIFLQDLSLNVPHLAAARCHFELDMQTSNLRLSNRR